MARLHLAAVLFAAALIVTSGTRLPLQAAAPAPAPGAAQTRADVLFIMEAEQGTFTDGQTLTLSGLTSSAQSFAVGGKTAVYPVAAFVGNQFVDTAGAWLGNPQAVFYGVNAQGNQTSAVLALSSPKINSPAPGTTNNNNNNNNNNNGGTITNNNNNGQTLSFTVAAVPADAAKVKIPGGAVSQKVAEASSGANNGFVSAITPGTQFSSIVLFIDTNQQSVSKVAATKWGWGGYYPYYYNQGYNYGYSSNNNNNNNNNNGGWGAVNNNNNNNNNGGYGANNNNNNNNNNGGWGAVNNNNNNNNNGGGANNNNNNNNNGRH